MRRSAGLPLAFLLIAGGALVGCGGSSDDDADSATSTTSSASSTTAAEVTTTVADEPADTGEGAAQVDLEFTGTYVLQIHGLKGACLGIAGRFAFEMTGDDVPGIGDAFQVSQVSGQGAGIAWVIDDNNSYAGSGEEGGATVSADNKSVQIDDDLVQLEPQGGPDRPQHVTGTITCP